MNTPNKANSFMFLLLIAIPMILSYGCSPRLPDPTWTDNLSVVHKKSDLSQANIDIDIYIDATTSMIGYAVSESSIYGRFLDQLEASALSAWRSADVNYFKFGETIRPIERPEFLRAKNDANFYREPGLFMRTYIDKVVDNTDPNRLSVVVTDLFQDEGDVNVMVDQIKSKCFTKDVMVGIIALWSDFNGMVYDVPAYPRGYFLPTTPRPFYALVFGEPDNMGKLFEALKMTDFVRNAHFLIISDQILNKADVTISKTRESIFVNRIAPRTKMEHSYDFSMKKKGNTASFDFVMNFENNPWCIDFNASMLETLVYKKSITDARITGVDSVQTKDIRFENLMREGNTLTATILLDNDEIIGNYSYQILLYQHPIRGYTLPDWVMELSTENPIPGTPSAAQTYNLEKLVSRLLVAKNSVVPTYISKSYINIYKR